MDTYKGYLKLGVLMCYIFVTIILIGEICTEKEKKMEL